MKYPTIRRRYPIFILLAIAVIAALSTCFGLLINITPSMNQGLYVRSNSPISRGDIVAVCLAEPFKSQGLMRHYIEKGYQCEGANPLIKEVVGVPGDKVILSDNAITVNGRIYYYETGYFDKAGLPLAVFPRGTYQHTTGYWLIGTHAKNSWDSRYWGPIQKNNILYKLRPLFVFD